MNLLHKSLHEELVQTRLALQIVLGEPIQLLSLDKEFQDTEDISRELQETRSALQIARESRCGGQTFQLDGWNVHVNQGIFPFCS